LHGGVIRENRVADKRKYIREVLMTRHFLIRANKRDSCQHFYWLCVQNSQIELQKSHGANQ
jgi:hypothetical protein